MVVAGDNPAGLVFFVVSVVFTLLALLAIGLRLWARRVTRAPLEFSDYAIFTAALFVLGQAAAGLVGVLDAGMGLHDATLTAPQRTLTLQTLFIIDICWMVANCFVKLSILHFLNSIFHRKPWFPRYIYTLITLVVATVIACLVGRFLCCRPLAFNWDRTIPGGFCLSRPPMSVAAASASLALDVVIFILPLPVILGLQMRSTRKLLLITVFGLGAVICVISALRIVSLVQADPLDMSFSSVGPSQWSILDNTLGVVSACLPLLPPLVKSGAGGRSTNPTSTHSPSNSTTDGPLGANRPLSGDMSTLAWGGTNRSAGFNGGIWAAHARPDLLHPHDRPRAYRGLGGRNERARGPPIAFHPRVFYPEGLRHTLSHHGSVSSVPSTSRLSSLVPSRSLSQRATPARDSRSASRLGSRVASRVGSRLGSRSGSRLGRHSDEEEGHDLTAYYYSVEDPVEEGKTYVEIVARGRRDSDGAASLEELDTKGITVTTTWDIDVESLQSAPSPRTSGAHVYIDGSAVIDDSADADDAERGSPAESAADPLEEAHDAHH